KANLAKQEAIANADGKITASEKKVIDDAKAKLNEAKQHTNQVVQDLQVGGRNFVLKSSEEKTLRGYRGTFYKFSKTLNQNEQYTFSLKFKSKSNDRVDVYFTDKYGGSPRQTFIRNITATNKPVTITIDKSWTGVCIYQEASKNPNALCVIEWIKVEKGNKATDWTPAPEDMDLKVREVKETLESSISQTNKEISLKVSKIYVDDKVNKIQNVGINLIEDSVFESWNNRYGFSRRTIDLDKDQDYTLSIIGKINTEAKEWGKQLRVFIYNNNWTWVKNFGIPTTEISRSTLSFKIPQDDKYYINFYMYPNGGNRDGQVYLDRIKLEKGNKATDWTPGLTDQVYRNKIISEINQTAEEIKISASKIQIDGSTTFAPGYNPTDKIGLGKLDHTIIEGGKIKTDLIKTREITALGNVEAGSFNLGNGKFVVDEEGNIISKSGKIGGWGISDRGIKSSNWDAASEESKDYPHWWNHNGRLMLDSKGGFLQAQGSTSDTRNRISEFSFKGVFANFPGQQCITAVTGLDYKASVVGIVCGYNSRNRFFEKDRFFGRSRSFGQDKRKRFGVYGRGLGKQTDNLAPTYGGAFEGGGAYCSRLIHGTLKDQNISGIENGWLTKDWVTIDVTDIGYLSLGATKDFGNIKLTGGVHGQQLTIFNKNKYKPIYIKDNAMLGKETQQISGGVSLTFIYDVSPTHPPQRYGSGQEGVWVPIGGYSPNDW
ncbi:MAG: hypothetical protein ACPGSG_08810, partial [Prolixibacteraceae bacterium]